MKKISLIIGAFLSVITMNSCYYSYKELTVRYVEPLRVGFITPIAADMEIAKEKTVYTEEFDNTLKKRDFKNILRSAQTEEVPIVLTWKKSVMASVIKKYDADDIIAPVFEICPNEDFSKLIVTVKGNLAKYVNYRKATQEDMDLIVPIQQIKMQNK